MSNLVQAVNEEIVTMTSLEVVELINNFRKEEGNKITKEHKDFMKSIRNEISSLEKVGITNGGNFSLVAYIDAKGEERPCYQMSKSGIMQMLNKESALVRYKTQQYIENLENRLKQPAKALSAMELLKLQYQALESHEQRFEKIEERLDSLEINPHQKRAIQKAKSKRVLELLGGRKSVAYKNASLRAKVYADMGRQYNNYFDISEYAYTPRNRFKEALELISSYNLTVELSMEVKQLSNQLAFA